MNFNVLSDIWFKFLNHFFILLDFLKGVHRGRHLRIVNVIIIIDVANFYFLVGLSDLLHGFAHGCSFSFALATISATFYASSLVARTSEHSILFTGMDHSLWFLCLVEQKWGLLCLLHDYLISRIFNKASNFQIHHYLNTGFDIFNQITWIWILIYQINPFLLLLVGMVLHFNYLQKKESHYSN